MITQEELKEFVSYDPATGDFRWIKLAGLKGRIGKKVGHLNRRGYLEGRINGKRIYLHRAAWLYMTGSVPPMQIDHTNGNRSDNRWENLREATNQQNSFNMNKRASNKSGVKGVFWNKDRKKWSANIHHNGKTKYLGLFTSKGEAAIAYASAAQASFGKFARIC